MIVRPYESKDFEMIEGWLQDRQHPSIDKNLLPAFGQVCDDVLAGFIIETDNGFAFLDYYVTNPKASLSDRMNATQIMFDQALERLDDRGFRYVVSFSKGTGVLKYIKRIGFSVDKTPYFMFRKVLEPQICNSMCVRRYEDSDFEMIRPWLCSEALEWIDKASVPKTGFIVDDYGCIFMLETDSAVCILDCFATNKSESLQDRIEAADLLCRHVQNHAFERGYKVMIGNTRSAKGLSLFTRHGFKYDPEPYFFGRRLVRPSSIELAVQDWQRALSL